MANKYKTVPITNIRELRIGDVVAWKHPMGYGEPVFVVAIFADPGTLGFQPEDYTGSVYCDFADNPGDVLEYKITEIVKCVDEEE